MPRFGKGWLAIHKLSVRRCVTMIPLVLAGLSVAFAFRTGLFSIFLGWKDSYLVGGSLLFGLDIFFAVSLPAILHIPLSILVGAIVGGLFYGVFIPGYLKGNLK